MATANPLREDNYELELNRVRENIDCKVIGLIFTLLILFSIYVFCN